MVKYYAAHDHDAIHAVGTTKQGAPDEAESYGAVCDSVTEISEELYNSIIAYGWCGATQSFEEIDGMLFEA